MQTPDVATPVRPLPVSRPGYVLVNGHWERAKPVSVTTPIPTTASAEIRDHRAVDRDPTPAVVDGLVVQLSWRGIGGAGDKSPYEGLAIAIVGGTPVGIVSAILRMTSSGNEWSWNS